jgi:uncharacterized protein
VPDGPAITHDQDAGRFELVDAPDAAHLAYRQGDGRLRLTGTEVADEFEGQGVGSALVRRALAYAEAHDLTIVPECSFVSGWLDRHPDRAAELSIAAT